MLRQHDWICYKDGLDKNVCDQIINLVEDKLAKSDENIHDRHIENLEDEKKTDMIWTEEQWIYDAIWSYMSQANDEAGWKYDIRSAETIQLARYKKGMFYDWHPDGYGDHFSVYRNIIKPKEYGLHRKLSMGVILNDDFEGGEFQIVKYDHLKLEMENEWKDYPSPESKIATVESSKGSVIVFPSDVYHRVKPVTKGIRYSLVAWFLGPPFI